MAIWAPEGVALVDAYMESYWYNQEPLAPLRRYLAANPEVVDAPFPHVDSPSGESGEPLLAYLVGNHGRYWAEGSPHWFEAFAIVKVLLEAGADPNARMSDGQLCLAHENCYLSNTLTYLLVEAGANANAMTDQGPLIAAALRYTGIDLDPAGEVGLLRMLLQKGAPLKWTFDSRTCFLDEELGPWASTRGGVAGVAFQELVVCVRKAGSWAAYCVAAHKDFLRFRSSLVRGRARTTNRIVEGLAHLPDGAVGKVLAYWLS